MSSPSSSHPLSVAPVTRSRTLTVVRILLGAAFVLSGVPKLIDHATWAADFERWHVPLPDVAVVGVGGFEVIGGLLLAVGIATRPVAAVFAAQMLGALLVAGTTDGGQHLLLPPLLGGLASLLVLRSPAGMTGRQLIALLLLALVGGLGGVAIDRGRLTALADYAPARVAADARLREVGPGPGGLQAVLDHHVRSTTGVAGATLSATSPRLRLRFRGAAGTIRHAGPPIRSGDTFRTASVTKPFTAAAVLRLVEGGQLRLDEPAGPLLPADIAARIGAVAPQVTVRQLLQHTSGLPDYGTDARWTKEVLGHPNRRWTPAALIDAGLRTGPPHGPPGQAFHYSDTGYVLLALILERVTGGRLAAAYRRLLPMQSLPATFLEGGERRGATARAHGYLGPVDLHGLHPSFDAFGGGGLVSTAGDLDAFARKLFRGRIFHRRSTLRAMLQTVPAGAGRRYGLGIGRRRLAGEDIWFHEGFFGAFLVYVPRLDLSIGGSVNQNRGDAERLITEVIERLT